ncbi:trypsin-like peptidase domain-containing protein [Streptomyces sp. bgisy027]|uniref:P-loop NTPase n=1 Tax=Streptomyces sp. bgisy027 TaxID=3413770 RepID=UPI003D744517
MEVWARRPEGGWSFGSGYRVSPRLVLTAGHVIRPESGASYTNPFVRLLTGDRQWQVRIVWCRLDRRMDAALLEITDADWEPPSEEPSVRWGVLSNSAPGVPCAASGFPMAQRQENGLRDTDQLAGTINPGTGVLRHRYEVEVHGTVRAHHITPSPWAGMSGAVALSAGMVVALLVEDPQVFRSARIDAVRAADLLAVAEFRQTLEQDTGRLPVLESVELAAVLEPADGPTAARSPAFLLRADSEVVPFHGREQELAELEVWCREPGFGVRMVTGPAGQGKTRLAREIVARLHRERRLAVWVTHGDPHTAGPDCTVLRTLATPVVLVVDYAETRGDQVRNLIEQALANRHGTAVRLLLLARARGDWWTRIAKGTSALLEDALRDVPVNELGPLETTSYGREATYRRALDAFATALSRTRPYDEVSWPRYAAGIGFEGALDGTAPDGTAQAVLALHTKALTDLLQAGPAPVPFQPGDSPEDVLLHHEWRYWSRHAEECGLRLPDRVLDRAVAAAALCAVDTEDRAARVLRTVLPTAFAGQKTTVAAATRWLRGLYPPIGTTVWGPLQPDRIAEQLVGRQIGSADDPLFDLLPELGEASLQHALTVLTRAMAHQPHLATVVPTLVRRRARHYAPSALTVAGQTDPPESLRRALTAVLENGRMPTELALTLFDRLPMSPGPFREASDVLSGRLTRVLVRVERKHGHAPLAATARTIETVATRAALAGDYETAIGVGDAALEYWRAVVAAENGGRYVRELAAACTNQAVHLGKVLLHRDALHLAEEAVDLLSSAMPTEQASPDDLAPALLNLADVQCRMGRLPEAIDSAERAVRIRRAEAEGGSTQDLHALATALAELAATRSEAGDPQSALDTVEEALRIWEAMPGAAGNRYAAALLTSSGALADLGRHAEALDTAEWAVAHCASEADSVDWSQRETLAKVWNAVSICLSELGRDNEAVSAGRKSVAHLYELVERNPRAHLLNTVSVMANLSHALSETGHALEALETAENALRLYGQHLNSGQAPETEITARLLDTVALRLHGVGRHGEALEASEQAVDYGRRLLERDPDHYRLRMSRLLTNHALILVGLERLDDAVRATRESVALARTAFLKWSDDAALSDLALAAYNAAIDIGEIGRLDEAVALAEESAGHYRALSRRHPEAYTRDLGDSLVVWGQLLTDLGNIEAGRARLREALEAFESCALTESVEETRNILDSLAEQADSPAPPRCRDRGA